jgi:exonuclease III
MDYKSKYLKYKKKYLQLIGGAKLNSGLFGNKYTKNEYYNTTPYIQNKFPFYCPNDKPFLCNTLTPNYGLCKRNLLDCRSYTGENEYPIYDINEKRLAALEFGKIFNYDLYKFNDKDCSKLIINSENSYSFDVPRQFKIMTYNCWWSLKKKTGRTEEDEFHREFFEIRIKEIAKIINESNADIVCLQEVGIPTFEILLPLLHNNYPFSYETPFRCDEDDSGSRGRTLETICFSKYPASNFKLFSVQGNLNYNNSMLMLEYNNLIIFNVYLQAGTRNSPGQKDLWFNYSRCRYNEYMAIGKYIKENNITKPIIVLGDFNTNLNGNMTEWPELRAFKQLKLQDAWLTTYDNTSGYTEDTSINYMRWNVKFEEKIYRIDGIFYSKNKFITNNINILGNEPINIDDNLQEQFKKFRIPNRENSEYLIRKNDVLQLWPSDHFAVIADLEFITN